MHGEESQQRVESIGVSHCSLVRGGARPENNFEFFSSGIPGRARYGDDIIIIWGSDNAHDIIMS